MNQPTENAINELVNRRIDNGVAKVEIVSAKRGRGWDSVEVKHKSEYWWERLWRTVRRRWTGRYFDE